MEQGGDIMLKSTRKASTHTTSIYIANNLESNILYESTCHKWRSGPRLGPVRDIWQCVFKTFMVCSIFQLACYPTSSRRRHMFRLGARTCYQHNTTARTQVFISSSIHDGYQQWSRRFGCIIPSPGCPNHRAKFGTIVQAPAQAARSKISRGTGQPVSSSRVGNIHHET